MPTADLIQTNFTAGEISPRLLGRVDIERYKNGVQALENALPLIHGGVRTMPMLRFNASANFGNRKCRLVRFEFSKTEAAIIELGHQYIRFFNADRTQVMSGMSPYEIVTVFTEDELFEIEYVGGADTILLFHENHPIQRLRRFDTDHWVIDNAPIDPAPFFEQGHYPTTTLTLSLATVGTGRTATAGASAFLPADVGRRITYNGGTALITAYTSATVVTVTIETAFASTSIPTSVWNITGSPQVVCNPSTNGEVGETISLTLSTGVLYGTRYAISASAYNGGVAPPEYRYATALTNGFGIGDIVQIEDCEPFAWNGTHYVTGDTDFLSGDDFQVQKAPNPGAMTKNGTARKVLASTGVDGWRAGDVGGYVSINGGLIHITSFSTAASVSGIVVRKMTSDVGAQANAWTLQSPMWSATLGYPRCGTFFQQRLVVGGTPTYPRTIFGSRSGEYYSFEVGVLDDDAFVYDLDAAEFDPILHLMKVKNQLVALTSGNEFAITGGVEAPLTPTNVQVTNPTDYGCNDVKPIRVENELMYMNRTGRKLRAMGYRFENDSFSSPDMTKLSEHVTGTGIVDIAYQQEPESIVWMVRDDGVLVSMTVDREEGVLAFARHTTQGLFESVAVIPNTDGVDELWVAVKRTFIAGGIEVPVRRIESFDFSTNYSMHSAESGTSVPGVTTITGLAHLALGSAPTDVEVIADGVYIPDMQVVINGADGEVTLPRAAYSWHVGLPARAYIKTLTPEMLTQIGTSQGKNQRISRVTVRMIDSQAVLINDQFYDARMFGDALLDEVPPPFDADIEVNTLGWDKNTSIEIEQPNPMPFHVLATIFKFTANEG